jgi:hypothetical protein
MRQLIIQLYYLKLKKVQAPKGAKTKKMKVLGPVS